MCREINNLRARCVQAHVIASGIGSRNEKEWVNSILRKISNDLSGLEITAERKEEISEQLKTIEKLDK